MIPEPRNGHPAAPRIVRPLTGLLLVLFVFQASIAALRDSVTIDEFVGLPVGLYTLQTVDFRSESMNPPFFRSFAALPLLLMGPVAPRIPPMNEINDWAMGYRFMNDYRSVYQALFVPARAMVILASVLLGALMSSWATRLYGWGAGLAALALFAFSPSMLTHGHLVTLDVSGAIGWAGVSYLTWNLFDRPLPSRAILLGGLLGLAPALKLSGIMLPIVTAILFLVYAVSERTRGGTLRTCALLAVTYLVALCVLNGLYRFDGFGKAFGDFDFESRKLMDIKQAAPWFRLPLPEPFIRSLDVLFLGDQPTEPAYFLAGNWSVDGWWYYHLVAFALKTSLPLLLTGLFAVGCWLAGRSTGARDYCVFIPILFLFVANSLFNPLNIGVRHALPAYPLLMVAASPWLARPIERFFTSRRDLRGAAGALFSVLLLAWSVFGTVSIAPRYFEYFNELAGGPKNGHRWLIDSNIDWGQDLIRLSEYMQAHDLSSVHLAYFGRVEPGVYGIRFTPLTADGSHGIAVVSASFLVGRPYWCWFAPDRFEWAHQGAFTWLQRYQPIDRVGSMFVFDLP